MSVLGSVYFYSQSVACTSVQMYVCNSGLDVDRIKGLNPASAVTLSCTDVFRKVAEWAKCYTIVMQ